MWLAPYAISRNQAISTTGMSPAASGLFHRGSPLIRCVMAIANAHMVSQTIPATAKKTDAIHHPREFTPPPTSPTPATPAPSGRGDRPPRPRSLPPPQPAPAPEHANRPQPAAPAPADTSGTAQS